MESRVNQHNIIESFQDEDSKQQIAKSLSEPSLCDLLIRWLERTPGLEQEASTFRGATLKQSTPSWQTNSPKWRTSKIRRNGRVSWRRLKQKDTFESLLNEERHNERMQKNERRLSYGAFMGALMVSCYSETPRSTCRISCSRF
ncbi:hypothetical protein BV898_12231 [Hypsibius exemplaris]|uniref:Uncharacterized protein n=1 Tax=Hypsibius exemplaris TaxID=2072580 RepID=A0A1W0WEF7_HYPEX|nr:hypothetical protein BV898_12231 [Hypsibius exemplaris]